MSSLDLLEACQSIVQIPSASHPQAKLHEGNAAVVRFLIELASSHLDYRVFDTVGRARDKTLILWPKGTNFPHLGGLALHTHLDTVPAGDLEKWTLAQPLSGHIVKDELVALGSADVKTDAICKIAALLDFRNSSNSRRLPFFVGSFSEEVGMYGIKWIAKKRIIRPEWALVGEPSEGNLSFANKGFSLLVGKIPFRPLKRKRKDRAFSKTFEGKAGHSSAPHLAKNALESALAYLADHPEIAIGDFEGSVALNVIPGSFELKSAATLIPPSALKKLIFIWKEHTRWRSLLEKNLQLSYFNPPFTTSQWTQLFRKGNSLQWTIDLRTIPGDDRPAERVPGAKLFNSKGLKLHRESPPFFQDAKAPFGEWLKPLLAERKGFITKSGANEARYYQDLKAQVFVCGAGVSYGNVHSPNERIATKALYEGAAFYRRIIEKLNRGD